MELATTWARLADELERAQAIIEESKKSDMPKG